MLSWIFAKFLRTPFLKNTSGRQLLYCTNITNSYSQKTLHRKTFMVAFHYQNGIPTHFFSVNFPTNNYDVNDDGFLYGNIDQWENVCLIFMSEVPNFLLAHQQQPLNLLWIWFLTCAEPKFWLSLMNLIVVTTTITQRQMWLQQAKTMFF